MRTLHRRSACLALALITAVFTGVMPGAPVAVAQSRQPLLSVGTPAPDFTVTTSDGRKVRLSDYKGRPVVLEFWATWCGVCIPL